MWDLTLGQHRARVHVAAPAPAVWAHLPWRLQIKTMDTHQIIVVDAATGHPLRNVARMAADRMACDIVFEPATAPGDYYIYYLPLRPYTNFNDRSGYVPYRCEADAVWLQQTNAWQSLPAANVLEFQARTDFDRFDPMEVIASDNETKELLARHPQPLLLFPEDRRHTIRMRQDLPLRWIQSGPSTQIAGEAQRNEYYAFQVGLFAPHQPANHLAVRFSDLRDDGGAEIPASALTCFNLGGIDSRGRPFTKVVDVPSGHVQPLWFGVDIAPDQKPGVYVGSLTIQAEGIAPQQMALTLNVLPQSIVERGDNEPWRHSRLRWLNSTAGTEDFIPKPYVPLKVQGASISCLGRTLSLAADGLPSAIAAGKSPLLESPVHFTIESDGGPIAFTSSQTIWTRQTACRVAWKTDSSASAGALSCDAEMEYDGNITFRLSFTPAADMDVKDIRLELPLLHDSAQYMIGAGLAGGSRPDDYVWKWDGPYDSFWIGSVNAGLHCRLLGASYAGPMLRVYHPAPPLSWGNGGLGGVSIHQSSNRVLATAFSGPRKLKAGELITFEFAFLITPVKPLDTITHFQTRYFHRFDNWTPDGNDPTPTPEALAAGVNVVNIHHAAIFNPYINYPFLKTAALKQFTDTMHRHHVKVKIYDTVRELSNMATELWALRSLGDEVIADGNGGGYAWCQEHMISGYRPSWFQRFSDDPPDASMLTSGESRWYNYYIEGLAWLVRNADIDGLYFDDVAYDRHILQRARVVMARQKPGCLIDLHSNTRFSVGPANQYTEFMPYVDRLWFGESFKYNAMSPDQWLVQCSGIPFGLMGDMLESGGNPWLGPIYGMTVRMAWRTGGKLSDPLPVWRLWDQFGIADSRMFGYWDPDCPVKTDNKDVLATVYRKPGKSLIALASWAPAATDVRLTIDWKALGLDPAKAILYAPASANFQPAGKWKPADPIPIESHRGWLLILDETGPSPARP